MFILCYFQEIFDEVSEDMISFEWDMDIAALKGRLWEGVQFAEEIVQMENIIRLVSNLH